MGLQYVGCSTETARAEKILQRGQWAADDLLGSIDDPLKGFPVRCWAAGLSHKDTVHQHTLHGAVVIGCHQFLLQVVFPEDPSCLLEYCSGVDSPGESSSGVCTQEPLPHSPHWCVLDRLSALFFWKSIMSYFVFEEFRIETVLWTPHYQSLDFISVNCLISSWDKFICWT